MFIELTNADSGEKFLVNIDLIEQIVKKDRWTELYFASDPDCWQRVAEKYDHIKMSLLKADKIIP